ncbi:MAG: oligosaccharide flippase family protein [Ignavibacteria bacterium]|nr:oligosaccharide flippase family protein [Ignavibacteria bacterium]
MIIPELKILAKDSIIYGIGNIINKFLIFLLLPLFTAYLKPEDYGILSILGLMNVFLSALFHLGTGSSLGILFFDKEDNKIKAQIIWSDFIIILIMSAILLSVIYIFNNNLSSLIYDTPKYGSLVFLSMLNLAFTNLQVPFSGYARMTNKSKIYMVISVITTISTSGLSIYFIVFLGKGIKGLLEVNAIVSLVMLILWIIVVFRYLKPGFSIESAKKLLVVGYPAIFGSFAFLFIEMSDRIFIKSYLGLSELGIYSIGYSFGLGILILIDAFSLSWPTYFVKFGKKRDEAAALFGYVLKYFIIIIGVVVLNFFLFAKPVVYLFTALEYHSAFIVVGIIASSYIFRGAYLIFLPGIYFEKKLHIQSIIEWTAALINIGLNFILTPKFGIVGAALSTLLTFISISIITFIVSRKYMVVSHKWKSIIIFFAGFIPLCLLSYINLPLTIVMEIIFKIIVLVMFIAYTFYFVLTIDERNYCRTILSNLKSKYLLHEKK